MANDKHDFTLLLYGISLFTIFIYVMFLHTWTLAHSFLFGELQSQLLWYVCFGCGNSPLLFVYLYTHCCYTTYIGYTTYILLSVFVVVVSWLFGLSHVLLNWVPAHPYAIIVYINTHLSKKYIRESNIYAVFYFWCLCSNNFCLTS